MSADHGAGPGVAGGAEPSAALTAAIEEAYRRFARYRIKGRVDGCPCGCITEADHARLRSGPLRELTGDDLETYTRKAMTTWGGSDDFRHFLPRLLELVTGSPSDVIGNEVALGKLSYAGWWSWWEPEREAVESVLFARWQVGLTLPPSAFDVDTWLCGVAIAGVDVGRYVDAWRASATGPAFDHLAEFLESNPKLLTAGKLQNAFYFDEGASVAGELREWVGHTMSGDVFQERLAVWYEEKYGTGAP